MVSIMSDLRNGNRFYIDSIIVNNTVTVKDYTYHAR